jgi:hypothetical protein
MEATLANPLRKECQGCSEARRPSRPASRNQSSGAIVTSQPWIQLTGGYARRCHLPAMDSADKRLRPVMTFVSVQPSSTTLFGVAFPLPKPQGRRDSHLRTMPKREIRMLHKATSRTWRPLLQAYQGSISKVATSASLSRKECQGGYARCQDHALARDLDAAHGNTQDTEDTEATLANVFRKGCKGNSDTRESSSSALRIRSSGAIVTS